MDFGSLKIELIGSRVWRRTRSDSGELIALFEVKDPNSGETGHFLYEMEWDKRDVESETVHTDNAALVVNDDNSPMAYNAFNITDNHGPDPREHSACAGCSIKAWGL